MNEWEQWFDDRIGWVMVGDITPEQMYQVFKARLIYELAVESAELLNPAELYDATIEQPTNERMEGE